MAGSDCRFVLIDVKESEIQDPQGYDVFEPTIEIELGGLRVFNSLGAKGAERVVVMHFNEKALAETRRLVANSDRHPEGEDDYRLWFYGTGCGLSLRRKATQLDVAVDVDLGMGPAENVAEGIHHVGRTTVRSWVEAIVGLSNELSRRFRDLNPEVFRDVKTQEVLTQELESWLIAHDS